MNSIRCCLAGVTILITLVDNTIAYPKFLINSQQLIRDAAEGLNPSMTATMLRDEMAKAKKTSVEVPVLTGYEYFKWKNNIWVDEGRLEFNYDETGLLSEELIMQYTGDKLNLESNFYYTDGGRKVRSITFMPTNPELGGLINDYYLGNKKMIFNTFFRWGETSLPVVSLHQLTGSATSLDSVIFGSINWNPTSAAWDTGSGQVRVFYYTDTSTIYMCRCAPPGGPYDHVTESWETVYRLNALGAIDTLITFRIVDGVRQIDSHTYYTYIDGKLQTTLQIPVDSQSSTYSETRTSFSYTNFGSISSYIVESRTSNDREFEFSTKGEYTFSLQSIKPHKEMAGLQNPANPISVYCDRSGLRITSADGVNISGITLFDLRGCLVNRSVPAFCRSGGQQTLPFITTAGSVNLLQIRTNRGVYNFKVNGTAASVVH